MSKPTKKEFTESHHPAKAAKPARRPTSDGFSPHGHVAQQAAKNWEERDNSERDKCMSACGSDNAAGLAA
jgi:hypothetical protein